jgi:hypothetical protein
MTQSSGRATISVVSIKPKDLTIRQNRQGYEAISNKDSSFPEQAMGRQP